MAKPLIFQRGWLLSHTMRCSRGKNRIGKTFDGVNPRSRTNKTSPAGGARLAHQEGKWRYSLSSPCHSGADPAQHASPHRGQVARRFAGFLDFRHLALTGFRAVAGLMLRGLPAATGVTAASGSGLKNARQPGLSWDLFLTMQAVTRSTSGISELHKRNASPLHACSSSGV